MACAHSVCVPCCHMTVHLLQIYISTKWILYSHGSTACCSDFESAAMGSCLWLVGEDRCFVVRAAPWLLMLFCGQHSRVFWLISRVWILLFHVFIPRHFVDCLGRWILSPNICLAKRSGNFQPDKGWASCFQSLKDFGKSNTGINQQFMFRGFLGAVWSRFWQVLRL